MNALPSSIEASLKDAGFTATEILVLQKLLDADGLTLRELAAKTGRSTGVLDQAMKKLLKKRIVSRQMINDVPKYVLHSLQSILDWIRDDADIKHQAMVRKYHNFEMFLESIKKRRDRPDMEYFEGDEGVENAYNQLLTRGRVFLCYGPPQVCEAEHPMCIFRKEFSYMRKQRDIFMRVITYDSIAGRKLQARDADEYKQTVLVDPDQCPLKFEMVIVGDTVACFQLNEKRACFIRYPEMAEEERGFFERLWQRHESKAKKNDSHVIDVSSNLMRENFSKSLYAKIFSWNSLRNCIAILSLASVLTYVLYLQNASVEIQNIRSQLQNIAATAALQFNSEDIEAVRTESDVFKSEYATIVRELASIKQKNPIIRYAYILRPVMRPDTFAFVAHADSLNPNARIDANGDGKIDSADENISPGSPYDATHIDVLHNEEPLPNATRRPYKDQWGTFMSGFAAIQDQKGNTVGILGLDAWSKDTYDVPRKEFHLVRNFFIIFCCVVICWLMIFHRSALLRFVTLNATKRTLYVLLISIGLSSISTYSLYLYTQKLSLQRMQQEVKSIAIAAALQFDPNDLNALRKQDDWKKPEWAKVTAQLKAIRENNKDLLFVYILRKSDQSKTGIVFLADSHSLNPLANSDDDPMNDVDANGDGVIDIHGPDKLQWPGQSLDTPAPEVFSGFNYALAGNFWTDQWGKVITGYSPIKDASGNTVAVLAIDMKAEKMSDITHSNFAPVLTFLIFAVLFVVLQLRFL